MWKNWTHNLGAKLLSLVVAVGLWFSVTSRLPSQADLVFPIEYENEPEGMTPVNRLPGEVKMRVYSKGRFLAIRLRDAFLPVDLAGSQRGDNAIPLNALRLNHPESVEIEKAIILDAKRLHISYDDTVDRDIPVSPSITGNPDAGHLLVGKVLVEPGHAHVKGPRRLVDEIALVHTEEIDIEGDKSTLRKRVKLESPVSETIEITPMTVEIGIVIEPRRTLELENIVFEIGDELPEEWSSSTTPGSIRLEVTGAKSVVDAAAGKQETSLSLRAEKFQVGRTTLRFKEIRGREIIFAAHDTFPLVVAPPWDAWSGPRPIGPMPSKKEKPKPAVSGEVVGTLPFPRELTILGVEPERFVLEIRKKPEQPELVRGPGLSP